MADVAGRAAEGLTGPAPQSAARAGSPATSRPPSSQAASAGAVRYWADILFSLIVLVLLAPVLWLMTLGDKKKAPPEAKADPAPAGARPDDIVRRAD